MGRTWGAAVVLGVGIAGLGSLLAWLAVDPVLTAAAVAVASVIIAVAFLRRTGLFEKDAVDVFYYGVAMIGVVVFFAQERALRAEREVDRRIAVLEENLRAVRERLRLFDVETKELEALAAQQAALRETVLSELGPVEKQIREALAREASPFTTQEAFACAHAMAGVMWPRPEPHGTDPAGTLRDVADRAAAEALCKQAEREQEQEREALRKKEIDLTKLALDPSSFAAIRGHTIEIDGQRLTVGTLMAALRGDRISAERGSERERLATVVGITQAVLSTAQENRETDKEAARESISPSLWSLRYEHWPYVLIWLLALKLSRGVPQNAARHSQAPPDETEPERAP